MAVYDPNMTLYFPEQFRSFTYFNQQPLINNNYVGQPPNSFTTGAAIDYPEYDNDQGFSDDLQTIGGEMAYDFPDPQTLRGILQTVESQRKDSNGNLVKSSKEVLWCTSPLQRGWFVNFLNNVYRVISGQNWPNEGGFYIFDLERVVGSDGRPQEEQNWNYGGTPL